MKRSIVVSLLSLVLVDIAAAQELAPASEEDAAALERAAEEAAPEYRKPETEKLIGIGGGQTLGGLRGVELEYYLGRVLIDAHVSIYKTSPEMGEGRTAWGVGLGAFYQVRLHDHAALLVGGRIVYASNGADSSSMDPYEYGYEASQLNLELPLRMQVYFFERIALHAEVGAVIAIVEGSGLVGDTSGAAEGTYVVAGATDLLGTLGFTYYFR